MGSKLLGERMGFTLLRLASHATRAVTAADVQAHTAVADAVLDGVVLLAYLAWHLYLKLVAKARLSPVVWVVCGCMAANVLPNVVQAIVLETAADAPLRVFFVLDLTTALLWCLGIFLIARGWKVQAPVLPDVARKHVIQLAVFGGIVWFVGFLLAMPLPVTAVRVFLVGLVLGTVAFGNFFLVRLFQGIQATRAAIEIQNLIPTARRLAFDRKYKQFLILCVSVIAFTVLAVAVNVGYAFASYDPDKAAEPAALLAFAILDILIGLVFAVGLGWLFHARQDESL